MKVWYFDGVELKPAIIKFVNGRKGTITILKFITPDIVVERETTLDKLFVLDFWNTKGDLNDFSQES